MQEFLGKFSLAILHHSCLIRSSLPRQVSAQVYLLVCFPWPDLPLKNSICLCKWLTNSDRSLASSVSDSDLTVLLYTTALLYIALLLLSMKTTRSLHNVSFNDDSNIAVCTQVLDEVHLPVCTGWTSFPRLGIDSYPGQTIFAHVNESNKTSLATSDIPSLQTSEFSLTR